VNWTQTLERVRSAAEFCASAGLTRFRIDEDELAIEVRRAPRRAVASVPASRGDGLALEAAPHSANGASVPGQRPPTVVKAEFVGIVRLSRPSVGAGTVLSEDRELAYVESLGIRNPVRSGGPGRISAVFVNDGEPVGYGQPLFEIESGS
jgi:acetyl-CoA carboxylase biotin carboxyl carrier protein